MTAARESVRQLLPVLDAAFRAEQSKMGCIVSRIEDAKRQLADLERPESLDPLSPAIRIGADILWETWVQKRRAALSQDLALLYRDRENARDGLCRALAKLEAGKQLERKCVLMEKQNRQRRSSW